MKRISRYSASNLKKRPVAIVILLSAAVWAVMALWPAHQIWHNANIITMDDSQPSASAIAWRRGVITHVGEDADVLQEKRWYTRVKDLQGRTVVPGLIDAHSHFPASGIAGITVDISSPPLGTVDTLPDLYARLQDALASEKSDDRWIIGFNYDQASLSEGQHPTRVALDKLSPDRPIYSYHSSGHMGVANTAALQSLGLSVDDYPDGLLQEHDAPSLASLVSDVSWRRKLDSFLWSRDDYLAAGLTTVNNGATSRSLSLVLYLGSRLGVLPMRVVTNPFAGTKALSPRLNTKRFRSGAIKIIVDGGPQGFTAFMAQPFYNKPGTSQAHTSAGSNRGGALLSFVQLLEKVRHYHDQGVQLALHGNGDAAIEMILDALQSAGINADTDHRTLIIHSQTARRDQIERMRLLGAVPSFFASHVYYWGDWHAKHVVGPERAQHLSPTGWAKAEGLRFSLHSDAPVTPVDPFAMLQYAAERRSYDGLVLGVEHRLTPIEALKAITIDAAWQHFIDDSVGSLEVGKFADLVVISDDLLSVDVDKLSTVQVLTTVINGKVEYSRDG